MGSKLTEKMKQDMIEYGANKNTSVKAVLEDVDSVGNAYVDEEITFEEIETFIEGLRLIDVN